MANALIIDCDKSVYGKKTKNKGHRHIINYLSKLKSTLQIEDGGSYIHCPEYVQIGILTELTADEVENRLYKGNYDYVGVVEDDDNRYGFIDQD